MKTSNDLRLTMHGTFSNGQQYEAKIRLNDECRNGHEDFSITGTVWEKGKPKIERNMVVCGAIGDELAKANPEFALINDLHLCDYNGVPMHATANMFYRLQNGFFQDKKGDFKTEFCQYYRISSEQFDKLNESREQDHFIALFMSMPEILENWKNQAKEAIAWLEEKTGLKFESKATKSHLILPDAEKLEELKNRVKSGYYSPELANARAEQKEADRRVAKIESIREKLTADIESLNIDAELDIALIQLFGTDDNVIFYKHTNNIVFNWKDSNRYGKTWTPEEVETFKQKTSFEQSHKITIGKA